MEEILTVVMVLMLLQLVLSQQVIHTLYVQDVLRVVGQHAALGQ